MVLIIMPFSMICYTCSGSDPADEDIDIGGNGLPVSSYPPVEIERDADHRSSRCVSPGSSSGKY